MRRNGTYLTCPTCDTSFYAKRHDIEKRGKRFCSMACKRPGPDADRFWKYIPADRTPDICWEWTGTRDDKGYGKIWSNAYRYPMPASRMSWEVHFGPITDGRYVCHRCDNPPCVNPGHLFLGTQADNMLDRAVKRGNPNAKLTAADVVVIRSKAAAGTPRRALACEYGVTYKAIREVVLRLTWDHVA